MRRKKKSKRMKWMWGFIIICVIAVLSYQCGVRIICSENMQNIPGKNTTSVKNESDTIKPVEEVVLPVLMFHHIDDKSNNAWVITPETLEKDLKIIRDAGYQPVSMSQLVDYVYHDKALPDKPMCITFDDGYLSNYEVAYPLLKQYQMKATIFSIGKTIGYRTYGDTGIPITPHFSYKQAVEMMNSGWIDVQSHTYDMHQSAKLETQYPVRETIAQLEDESDSSYVNAVKDDLTCYQEEYHNHTGRTLFALAYPKGKCSVLTEQMVHELGYQITFTINSHHKNIIVQNQPETLYQLGRLNVSEDITEEELRQYLTEGYLQ